MKLTGPQVKQLHDAILFGFTPNTLRQMARIYLDVKLHEVAGGENSSDVAFDLIEWAERAGRLPDLVHGMYAANPTNSAIKAVWRDAQRWFGAAPPAASETAFEVSTLPVVFEWITIPAGDFVMGGDPKTDAWVNHAEKPRHRLYLPAYRIARLLVTNAQFMQYVEATGAGVPSHWTHRRIPPGRENHPVVNVSWHEAVAFCEWAGVRLPSEAEWEKAARGTDARIWPWGDDPPTPERCNYNLNVGTTTPVGQYAAGASAAGLLDMAGNVAEWTVSLWGKFEDKPTYRYPYVPSDGRENSKASNRIHRVVRGGSFSDDAARIRCASRSGWSPARRSKHIGFRVALSPTRF